MQIESPITTDVSFIIRYNMLPTMRKKQRFQMKKKKQVSLKNVWMIDKAQVQQPHKP